MSETIRSEEDPLSNGIRRREGGHARGGGISQIQVRLIYLDNAPRFHSFTGTQTSFEYL